MYNYMYMDHGSVNAPGFGDYQDQPHAMRKVLVVLLALVLFALIAIIIYFFAGGFDGRQVPQSEIDRIANIPAQNSGVLEGEDETSQLSAWGNFEGIDSNTGQEGPASINGYLDGRDVESNGQPINV